MVMNDSLKYIILNTFQLFLLLVKLWRKDHDTNHYNLSEAYLKLVLRRSWRDPLTLRVEQTLRVELRKRCVLLALQDHKMTPSLIAPMLLLYRDRAVPASLIMKCQASLASILIQASRWLDSCCPQAKVNAFYFNLIAPSLIQFFSSLYYPDN